MKLAGDLIYQPEHIIENKQKAEIIKIIDSEIGELVQDNWKKQLKALEALICVKWSLIILNNYKTEADLEKQLTKAKAYYEEHSNTFE